MAPIASPTARDIQNRLAQTMAIIAADPIQQSLQRHLNFQDRLARQLQQYASAAAATAVQDFQTDNPLASPHSEDAAESTGDAAPPSIAPRSGKGTAATRAGMTALIVYVAAALAFHVSNVLGTRNRVFDPHQLISDEIMAICLALAVWAILPHE